MANGLNAAQQTQLQGILQNQFGLGRSNAQSFVNGGNQSVLGNLASQSTANAGTTTTAGSGSGVGSFLQGGQQILNAGMKTAADVTLANFYDNLSNSSNRLSVDTFSTILRGVAGGVSNLASLNIPGLFTELFSTGGALATKFLKDLAETQSRLIDVTNKSGSFVGELGSNMREELSDAMVETTKLGMTVDDFLKSTEILLTSSGRMALYSKEAINDGVKASIAYTKSSTTLLENNESFRNVGYGLQDAAKVITAAGQKTLELGLNAKVLTETLVKNIGKLNEFGFQGGIAGLTRMSQQAQSLNFNMDNTLKIANDLFDPNKAIDMAANLSMIGGAIGDFGDPLRMIYDATNNVEGLQTSLINASKSLATFNSAQGRFEVTGANLRRAKAMADTFGISMGDLTSLAVKANVQFQAMSQIRSIFPEASKEQQEFIKNLSTMKDGKIGISIPAEVAEKFGVVDKFKDGFMEFSEFAKLDSSKRDQLIKEQQKIAAMKPEDVARGQFNATTQILNVISAMYIQQQNQLRRTGPAKTLGEAANDFAKNMSTIEISKNKSTQELINDVTKQAQNTLSKYYGNVTPNELTVTEMKNSKTENAKIEAKNSTTTNANIENKNNTSDGTTQKVDITHTITASDSTMDAMTKHWSKNLQSLELIGLKINNKPKSFDSTQKVLKKTN
jgi:hypothetical protein